MKRLAGYAAISSLTLAVLFGVWQFRVIVILVFLSVFLAAAVRPSINYMTRFKIPASVAQLMIYGLVIGFFSMPLILYGRELSGEIVNLMRDLRVMYSTMHGNMAAGSDMEQMIVDQIFFPTDSVRQFWQSGFLTTIFDLTQNLVALGGGVALVLIMSVYWSADQNHFERLWLSFLDPQWRIHARRIWREIEESIGSYIVSQLSLIVMTSLALGGAFFLLDMPYAVLLTLLAAGLVLIPLVGGGLSVLAAFLIGMLQGQFTAILAAVITATVIIVLRFVIQPRFFKNGGSSELLTLLFAAALVSILGLIGLFLAPLFSKAVITALNQIINIKPVAASQDQQQEVAEFKERLSHLVSSFDQDAAISEVPAELRNLVNRLDGLINRSGEYLQNHPQGLQAEK